MERSLNDLIGKNIVVYDLEIKNNIDKVKIGWKDFHLMGISVGVCFDYREMRYRVFMDDNINSLVSRLNEDKTLAVAFNHIGFDNNLLKKDPLITVPLRQDTRENNYDMLVESRMGAGADMFAKGFTLDNHLEVMGLPMKSGHGSNAPELYQQGRLGELIDYTITDVDRERRLFERVWLTGQMACTYQRTPYQVKLPVFN